MSRGDGRRVLLVVLTIYSGLCSAGASTKSACVFMSYVIQCICALKGWTFVRQRPAGCSKRRVTVGKLQPPGHGDTSPLHVPGGERQRNHPAGCTEGYEGTCQSDWELRRKSHHHHIQISQADFPVLLLKSLILNSRKLPRLGPSKQR